MRTGFRWPQRTAWEPSGACADLQGFSTGWFLSIDQCLDRPHCQRSRHLCRPISSPCFSFAMTSPATHLHRRKPQMTETVFSAPGVSTRLDGAEVLQVGDVLNGADPVSPGRVVDTKRGTRGAAGGTGSVQSGDRGSSCRETRLTGSRAPLSTVSREEVLQFSCGTCPPSLSLSQRSSQCRPLGRQ